MLTVCKYRLDGYQLRIIMIIIQNIVSLESINVNKRTLFLIRRVMYLYDHINRILQYF